MQSQKIHSVHALRFFAALGVVVHHALMNFHFRVDVGAAGVDVFFIISGLVIGLSLQARETPREFALKRFIRVIPMYWIATAGYIAISYFVWGFSAPRVMYWRSFALWPVFGTEWYPIYYPAWTLEYEMFFYVLATIALIAVRQHARLATLIVMGCLIATPIAVPFGREGAHFGTGFFLEFCAGLVISMSLQTLRDLPKAAGAALIAAALVIFALNYMDNPAMRPLAWGIPAMMLVVGLLPFDTWRFFTSAAARFGGDISYALYLTHLSALQIVSVIGDRLHLPVFSHVWSAALVAIPATVLLAALVHVCIERPLLDFLRAKLLPRRVRSAQAESATQAVH